MKYHRQVAAADMDVRGKDFTLPQTKVDAIGMDGKRDAFSSSADKCMFFCGYNNHILLQILEVTTIAMPKALRPNECSKAFTSIAPIPGIQFGGYS